MAGNRDDWIEVPVSETNGLVYHNDRLGHGAVVGREHIGDGLRYHVSLRAEGDVPLVPFRVAMQIAVLLVPKVTFVGVLLCSYPNEHHLFETRDNGLIDAMLSKRK